MCSWRDVGPEEFLSPTRGAKTRPCKKFWVEAGDAELSGKNLVNSSNKSGWSSKRVATWEKRYRKWITNIKRED